MRHIIVQVTNGASILCMIGLTDNQILLKKLLIHFVHLSLKIIAHYTIGLLKLLIFIHRNKLSLPG